MNQNGLLTELIFRQRNQEVLQEAAKFHLANEALRSRASSTTGRSKTLGWIGNQLRLIGHKLQERYDEQMMAHRTDYTQNSQSDCA
jgi:hypothetical protein